LIAGGLDTLGETGTITLGEQADGNIVDPPITIKKEVIPDVIILPSKPLESTVLTTNVSHLLVGVRTEEYTRLDKMYHWLKTRAIRNQIKKQDREMRKMAVKNLEEQITQLNKKKKLIR